MRNILDVKSSCLALIKEIWGDKKHITKPWIKTHTGEDWEKMSRKMLLVLEVLLKYKKKFGQCPLHEGRDKKKEYKLKAGGNERIKKMKLALIAERGEKCEDCGRKKFEDNNFITLDHITPVYLGGKTVKENCRLLCVPCHNRKSKREGKESKRRYMKGKFETDVRPKLEFIYQKLKEKNYD